MPPEVPVLGPRTRSRGPRSAFWNGPDCTPAELQGAGPCSVGVSLQPFDLLAVAALPRSRSVPIESGSASSTSPRETGRGAWDWCCRRWRGRFRNEVCHPRRGRYLHSPGQSLGNVCSGAPRPAHARMGPPAGAWGDHRRPGAGIPWPLGSLPSPALSWMSEPLFKYASW